MAALESNPWVVLTFMAAPAILTNASTVLALGTSNRLARVADRLRATSTTLLASKSTSDPAIALQLDDFMASSRRVAMMIDGLRRFYFAAGSFAAATCVILLGSAAAFFGLAALDLTARVLAILATVLGVGGLSSGALRLVAETRLALSALDRQVAAVKKWEETHHPPAVRPGL